MVAKKQCQCGKTYWIGNKGRLVCLECQGTALVRKVKTLIGLWPELEEGNFLWDPQRLEWSQSAAECLKFSRQCYLCPIATAYGREFPICKMPYTVRILGEFIGDGEVA